MSLSSNTISLDISNNLQHNLYYEGQLLTMIPELLKHVKRHAKGYVVDVIETAHFFMKMYEKFSTDRQSIIIQKKRKSRAKAAKPKKKGKDGEMEEGGDDENNEEGDNEQASPSKSYTEEKLDFKIFQLV